MKKIIRVLSILTVIVLYYCCNNAFAGINSDCAGVEENELMSIAPSEPILSIDTESLKELLGAGEKSSFDDRFVTLHFNGNSPQGVGAKVTYSIEGAQFAHNPNFVFERVKDKTIKLQYSENSIVMEVVSGFNGHGGIGTFAIAVPITNLNEGADVFGLSAESKNGGYGLIAFRNSLNYAFDVTPDKTNNGILIPKNL